MHSSAAGIRALHGDRASCQRGAADRCCAEAHGSACRQQNLMYMSCSCGWDGMPSPSDQGHSALCFGLAGDLAQCLEQQLQLPRLPHAMQRAEPPDTLE